MIVAAGGENTLSSESGPDFQAIQNEILELIATGGSLVAVADALCRRIEQVAPEAICSVLRVGSDDRVYPLAAPRLPDDYSAALRGTQIGPAVGSCGTAAFLGEPVLVASIATDPLWAEFRALAGRFGLKACWSSPIKARGGRVIGTFALYFLEERGPTDIERLAVQTSLHLCAIAIEQTEIRERNRRLAYYDVVTGLPNRLHADAILKRTLETSGESVGMLLIDIDHLKVANDTLGHAAGDALIREVARRIEAAVRGGSAGRVGGDEFVVILDDCRAGVLRAVADRVIAAMHAPFTFEDHTIRPSVTIGGAVVAAGGSADTLRQNADFALYHSKEGGRARYTEFTEDLRTGMMRRLGSVRQLELALHEDRVVPYYQPIVRIDTGEIIGVEALARIRRDDGTILEASGFADALTDLGLAQQLTRCMLEKTPGHVAAWLRMGIPFQHVGINVTSADFYGSDLEQHFAGAFKKVGVSLKHVILEVTETVFVDPHNVVAQSVERLRAKGLRVALDDFGTGFASLTHLLSFPVDILKIDKSFVDRMSVDSPSEVIVAGLIDIARKLGVRVVAEGIETEERAARLLQLGCRLGQGYLYYKPADFQTTTTRLLDNAQGIREPAARLA